MNDNDKPIGEPKNMTALESVELSANADFGRVPLPPTHVLLAEDFVPNHEQVCEELEVSILWDTQMKSRGTASFGVPYNYGQMAYLACTFPPALDSIRDHLRVLQVDFNNCLVNYYGGGDSSMGFHYDDTSILQPGTGVAIVSLGSLRTMHFRNRDSSSDSFELPLLGGSLLYMNQTVQDHWHHAIPAIPTAKNQVGIRLSLTWRAIASW